MLFEYAVEMAFIVKTVCRGYRDALNVVDAMLVVLPHHLHKEVTVERLNAGKHVLCEKPLANSEMKHFIERVREIIVSAAWAEGGRI